MELKLVELGDHLALLSTDNEEVEIKNNIDIKVEIFLNDTVEIVSLKTLETFHNFIKNVLDIYEYESTKVSGETAEDFYIDEKIVKLINLEEFIGG